LLEAAPDALIVVNEGGEIVILNAQAEKQFGYVRDELLGQSVQKIIPEGFAGELIAHGAGSTAETQTQRNGAGTELKGRRKNGHGFPIELTLSPLRTADGILVTVAIRDISTRKRAESHLLQKMEELNRAQVTLDCIGDAVVCTDPLANVTFLNLAAEELTGWPLPEALGRPLAEVLHVMETSDDSTASTAEIAILHNCAELVPTKCILTRRDGFEIQIENSVAPIHDQLGRASGAVVVFRDTSAAEAMARQIAHAAEHDCLTDLPNARLLESRITKAIKSAWSHGRRVAILFLDLDGFKYINDSLGHSVGDKLLQSVAKRLLGCVRVGDTVSRQGGDEFVVLLPDVEQPEEAATLARRLLSAVAEAHSANKHDLHITTSIGVSMFPDDGLDGETLIKSADTAMYQAKENGRQGFQFFKPAMNARAVERQSIEESLRLAVERQEFSLYYQPKIDLSTGAITGAEALIRWAHPSRGLLSPAQFIPIAEECGLILPIGRWVAREACAQAQSWADAGFSAVTVAINVSAMEFRCGNFVSDLFATLRETRLPPSSLELELTESVFMRHTESAAAILQALRQTGVQVAVDDFGTGYSSLSYLRKLPLDTLKLDQSFMRQVAIGGAEAAIVTAVLSMARSLKLRVVAEGVETKEELEFLRSHDCEQAQGYFFSRPVPPEQFVRLLQSEADRQQPTRAIAYGQPARAMALAGPECRVSTDIGVVNDY
jgi:diguanylate cyclase (GGDEF)-like protein/PAS domain S-box-containing protein